MLLLNIFRFSSCTDVITMRTKQAQSQSPDIQTRYNMILNASMSCVKNIEIHRDWWISCLWSCGGGKTIIFKDSMINRRVPAFSRVPHPLPNRPNSLSRNTYYTPPPSLNPHFISGISPYMQIIVSDVSDITRLEFKLINWSSVAHSVISNTDIWSHVKKHFVKY